jgi:hypothetical protein
MHRPFLISIFLLVAFALGSCIDKTRTSNIQDDHIGRLSLFILAGQSNMVGFGAMPETVATDERVYVFGNNYQWRVASEPVDDATDQVDEVSLDAEAGFGPATSFAFRMLEKDPNLVIGLIPCAKGSSSIEEWQQDDSVDTLYGSCLKRVRTAAEVGEVAGLLFFQGETEAVDPNLRMVSQQTLHPEDWDVWFAQMVEAFRQDLTDPDLPVVFAQIGQHEAPDMLPNWEQVKDVQRSVSHHETSMIITEDLPLGDPVHYSTEGYRAIGERFAEAMWALMSQ